MVHATQAEPLVQDDATRLVEVYRALVRARALESRWSDLEKHGAAVPRTAAGDAMALAGAALALEPEDWVFGEGTELALALARGASLADFVAHAFGRGPNPWARRDRRTLGSDLRNGAHVTHGVGVAWAAKSERRELAVLVTFDEAIFATGECHNGINFAGVFKVPAVFLVRSRHAERPIDDVAAAYGIAGVACNGNDVFAVAHAVREARQRGLSGLGPTLIEAAITDEPSFASLTRHLEQRGLFSAEQQARLEAAAVAEIVVPTGPRPE